jgi:hypothetical protein
MDMTNTSVKLPRALRDALVQQAEREDRSLSGQIRHLLVAASEEREQAERLPDPAELEWR